MDSIDSVQSSLKSHPLWVTLLVTSLTILSMHLLNSRIDFQDTKIKNLSIWSRELIICIALYISIRSDYD